MLTSAQNDSVKALYFFLYFFFPLSFLLAAEIWFSAERKREASENACQSDKNYITLC